MPPGRFRPSVAELHQDRVRGENRPSHGGSFKVGQPPLPCKDSGSVADWIFRASLREAFRWLAVGLC